MQAHTAIKDVGCCPPYVCAAQKRSCLRLHFFVRRHLTAIKGVGCYAWENWSDIASSLFVIEEYVSALPLRRIILRQMCKPMQTVYSMRCALRWCLQVRVWYDAASLIRCDP